MASKRAGAEVGEPGSHYLLVAVQVTAHPCRSGRRPANLGWLKAARVEFAVQWGG